MERAKVLLTTVRDNLRHASVSTTSGYLHTERKNGLGSWLRRLRGRCADPAEASNAPSSEKIGFELTTPLGSVSFGPPHLCPLT